MFIRVPVRHKLASFLCHNAVPPFEQVILISWI
jgi:hypothetical protein